MEEVTESSVRTTQETFMPLVLQSNLESDATQLQVTRMQILTFLVDHRVTSCSPFLLELFFQFS